MRDSYPFSSIIAVSPAHTRKQVMNITRNGDGSYGEGAAFLLLGGWEVRR